MRRLLEDASRRAIDYLEDLDKRSVAPVPSAVARLVEYAEQHGVYNDAPFSQRLAMQADRITTEFAIEEAVLAATAQAPSDADVNAWYDAHAATEDDRRRYTGRDDQAHADAQGRPGSGGGARTSSRSGRRGARDRVGRRAPGCRMHDR